MRAFASLCIIATCFCGAAVSAQESSSDETIEEARREFLAGEAAYAEGHFDEALRHFQRAYELTGNSDLLYNVATVADRAREDRVALDAYRGYLAAQPGAEDTEHITGRIQVLEQQLREADAEDAREREAREREEQLRREADDARAREAAARRREEEARRSGADDPGAAPWVMLGAGGAVAVGGVVLLIVALDDIAAVETPGDPMPRWADVADAADRAPILSTVGAIAIGVGGAALAGGLIWGIATAGSGAGGEDVAVALGPGGVSVRGSFR